MNRELPRGPFDAYLRAHYFNDAPRVLPRFAMGCGAMFMIQRVASLEASLTAPGSVAETDPLLLEEMIALVVAQGLDVVSIDEMRRRLMERDLERRFVVFTFDGAYRSVLENVLPLFERRGMPFAVYAASDYLPRTQVPWWLALEGLVKQADRLTADLQGSREELRCRTPDEERQVYKLLHSRLSKMTSLERADLIAGECKRQKVDCAELAERQMLSGEELMALHGHKLVTVGSNGGGVRDLSELSFDDAREGLSRSRAALEVALGACPAHLAFPGSATSHVTARDVRIARDLGFQTAATGIEGALWPEHARELLALPRIALDNNPATLVRAIMLGGEGPLRPVERRARKGAA